MPGIRVVPEIVPSECSVTADIEGGIGKAMDAIITALTAPLTVPEKSPPLPPSTPPGVVFKGTLEEVNQFFYRRGWTDGLPVIPPTEAAVAEMLGGTDLPADYVVGDLPPMKGHATIKKIAINAVMAGCLPTYMPLLIAGVECMLTTGAGTRSDPNSGYGLATSSAGSWGFLWIVNGPVRDQIHVNYATGALGPGNIANQAIGRALYLITKNIGGSREGVECMASLGSPWRKGLVVGEREAESPWESLSVQAGFNKEDSTISLTIPNSLIQASPYGTDAKGILQGIMSNVAPTGFTATIMITVDNANQLARSGFTKQKLMDYLAQNTAVPAREHPTYYSASPAPNSRTKEIIAGLPKDPNTPMKVLSGERLNVFVAGGPTMFGIFEGGRNVVTRKARLPANWDRLVKKYDNMVPVYVKY